MSKSVIVTGSSGMIGTVLSESLIERGNEVTGVDLERNRWSDTVDDVTIEADLCRPKELEKLPGNADLIVHLAANARVHQLVENPCQARNNFEMSFNILEFARESNITNIILGSSREVYGNRGKIIYDETDTYVDECESPYTASKIGSEAMAKAYDRCYGIDSCTVRFSNVYGKYDDANRVIPLFIGRALNDRPLTVYGGDKLLDFTYVEDCVQGLLRCIDNLEKSKSTTFNIASGTGTSLLEVADEIIEQTSSDSEIRIESSRTGEVSRYVADLSKAKKILDYEPNHTLTEGVRKTINWYREHEEILDEIEVSS